MSVMSIILNLIGSIALIGLGAVTLFLGALGNSAGTYVSGALIVILGGACLVWTIASAMGYSVPFS
jgi:hypothetical protein